MTGAGSLTRRTALALFGAAAAIPRGASAAGRRRVEIFGHRGAAALRPEHTLAAYARAIADGAKARRRRLAREAAEARAHGEAADTMDQQKGASSGTR